MFFEHLWWMILPNHEIHMVNKFISWSMFSMPFNGFWLCFILLAPLTARQNIKSLNVPVGQKAAVYVTEHKQFPSTATDKYFPALKMFKQMEFSWRSHEYGGAEWQIHRDHNKWIERFPINTPISQNIQSTLFKQRFLYACCRKLTLWVQKSGRTDTNPKHCNLKMQKTQRIGMSQVWLNKTCVQWFCNLLWSWIFWVFFLTQTIHVNTDADQKHAEDTTESTQTWQQSQDSRPSKF